jgi:hypothetical protein
MALTHRDTLIDGSHPPRHSHRWLSPTVTCTVHRDAVALHAQSSVWRSQRAVHTHTADDRLHCTCALDAGARGCSMGRRGATADHLRWRLDGRPRPHGHGHGYTSTATRGQPAPRTHHLPSSPITSHHLPSSPTTSHNLPSSLQVANLHRLMSHDPAARRKVLPREGLTHSARILTQRNFSASVWAVLTDDRRSVSAVWCRSRCGVGTATRGATLHTAARVRHLLRLHTGTAIPTEHACERPLLKACCSLRSSL